MVPITLKYMLWVIEIQHIYSGFLTIIQDWNMYHIWKQCIMYTFFHVQTLCINNFPHHMMHRVVLNQWQQDFLCSSLFRLTTKVCIMDFCERKPLATGEEMWMMYTIFYILPVDSTFFTSASTPLELVTQNIIATWILWSSYSFQLLEQSVIISSLIPVWRVPYQIVCVKQHIVHPDLHLQRWMASNLKLVQYGCFTS